MSDTMADRVRRGAALLDARRPGWAATIRLPELAMGDCSQCVLGQHFGSYSWGTEDLHLGLHEAPDFGFDITLAEGRTPKLIRGNLWDELGTLWAAEVRARTTTTPDGGGA